MLNLADELNKLKLNDYDHNKFVLLTMQKRLLGLFPDLNDEILVDDLYKSELDQAWLLAQCQSANNQINKILNDDSKFLSYYKGYVTEEDLKLFSRELIYDLRYLDTLSNFQLDFEDRTDRSNYISSHQFFLHAKFAFFSKKYIAETTNRNFLFSSMPTLIRQAIELKIKNMIGFERVTEKNGNFKIVSISRIIKFFDDRKEFFEMPLPMKTLLAINEWTNTFIHTGIVPFCWQSLEAIDLIECLFSIEDEEAGILSLHGFSYIAKGVSLDSVRSALDNDLNAKFSLNSKKIEGVVKK